MDPYHHRQLARLMRCGRPHVQHETIFAWACVGQRPFPPAPLHTVVSKFCGLTDARPFRWRLRSLPSQISDGRGGVRNAEEDIVLTIGLTFDYSAAGLYPRTSNGEGERRG